MSSTAPSPADYVAPPVRMNLSEAAPRQYAAQLRFSQSIELDEALRHLVDIRVSQINGCAFCLDMHARAAREAGESEQRLDTLAGWREAPFFTARERAALDLAEAMTRLTGGHVADPVWEEAARRFEPAELAQVVAAITVINGWNRIIVATQFQPAAR